jgi:hypothetical protein
MRVGATFPYRNFPIFQTRPVWGAALQRLATPTIGFSEQSTCRTSSRLPLGRKGSAAHHLRATTLKRTHPLLTQLP